MAVQVKLFSPTGTQTDITSRLIDDWPNLDITLERETCVYTPGEMAFTAKNEDSYFNTLFSGAEPNQRFNETTQLGAWAIKVYKNSAVRWLGNVDVESITFDNYSLKCSFTCFGRLKRLEQYNAAKVKRALPDGSDATVLEFTSEKGRRVLDFTGHSAQYDLLEVGDVIHVQKLHVNGKFTEQDITVKTKLGSNQLKVKERLKAAYIEGICKTPFYRGKTLGYLLVALWTHATIPGGSMSYNTVYASTVIEYADFTGKNVAEAVAELSKVFFGKTFANASGYVYMDRNLDATGAPTKDVTALLADEASLKLIDEDFYDLIIMRGRSPVKDREHVVRVGHCTYPKRELEIQTDFIYDHDTLETIGTALYNAWSVRRNRYEAKVLDDGTAYVEGQTVTISSANYWVISIAEPLRAVDADFRDVVTLTLLAKTGSSPDAAEVDIEADTDDEPPEPPTIVACSKTYADWPTMKAQYPSKSHPRVVVESGSWEDDAGDLHVFYKKWRMYFLVLQWEQDDLKGKLDGFHIVVFKDGDDEEKEKWEYNIPNPVPRTDSAHAANLLYYWRPIKVRVDMSHDWRVSCWAIFEDGRKSEWADDVQVGDEGEDSTLPVPVIDSITAEKKKVTLEISIPDTPTGSRIHVGWLQVFESVGTSAIGTPETSPANWKKIDDKAIDDDIRRGTYGFKTTSSFKNDEVRYFTARCAFVDNKDIKGDFCTALSASGAGSGFSVVATASPASGPVTQAFNFSASVTGGTGPFTYAWYFSDGTTGSGPNPSHTFPAPGVCWGYVVVTDSTYNTAQSLQAFVTVGTAGDFAVAVSGSPYNGNYATTTFNAYCTPLGGTAPYTYDWNWGDGTAHGTTQNASHQFTAPGLYTLSVTVTDAAGKKGYASYAVWAWASALTVSATASAQSGNRPLTVTLYGAVSGGVSPYTYEWDFGDGTAKSTQQNPQHTFAEAGSYTVILRVKDSSSPVQDGMGTVSIYALTPFTQIAQATLEAAAEYSPGNAWTNLSNLIDANSATLAYCQMPAEEGSKYLKVTDVGFLGGQPQDGKVIDWITFKVYAKSTDNSDVDAEGAEFKLVQLLIGGVPTGSVFSGAPVSDSGLVYHEFTWPYDTCQQLGITPANVRDINFGVYLKFRNWKSAVGRRVHVGIVICRCGFH